mmetsp:Transcript_42557/g.66668  ORF Transcript_42557/g.66668 Transcript_42557/m.66668 type:complete len:219 (-) Transcript_42557:823-1479(-)
MARVLKILILAASLQLTFVPLSVSAKSKWWYSTREVTRRIEAGEIKRPCYWEQIADRQFWRPSSEQIINASYVAIATSGSGEVKKFSSLRKFMRWVQIQISLKHFLHLSEFTGGDWSKIKGQNRMQQHGGLCTSGDKNFSRQILGVVSAAREKQDTSVRYLQVRTSAVHIFLAAQSICNLDGLHQLKISSRKIGRRNPRSVQRSLNWVTVLKTLGSSI